MIWSKSYLFLEGIESVSPIAVLRYEIVTLWKKFRGLEHFNVTVFSTGRLEISSDESLKIQKPSPLSSGNLILNPYFFLTIAFDYTYFEV